MRARRFLHTCRLPYDTVYVRPHVYGLMATAVHPILEILQRGLLTPYPPVPHYTFSTYFAGVVPAKMGDLIYSTSKYKMCGCPYLGTASPYIGQLTAAVSYFRLLVLFGRCWQPPEACKHINIFRAQVGTVPRRPRACFKHIPQPQHARSIPDTSHDASYTPHHTTQR